MYWLSKRFTQQSASGTSRMEIMAFEYFFIINSPFHQFLLFMIMSHEGDVLALF